MARLPDGVVVETRVAVADASTLTYAFGFSLPPDGAGLEVFVGNAAEPVSQALYEVSVAEDGQSGSIRFYGASEVAQPQQLLVGDMVLMRRNTLIAQVVAPGGSGFASARSVQALADAVQRVLEEMAAERRDG